MTNEQAIKWLKDYIQNTPFQMEQYERAFEMAIKALSQEPCDDVVSRQVAIDTIESWLSCDDYNETERHIMRAMQSVLYDLPSVTPKSIVCDDAISREWLMRKATERFYTTNYFNHISAMIEEAPPVTQKSGKWNEYYTSQKGNDVFNCKECGHTFIVTQGKDNMNFCPNCGAKMEREEKE